MQLLCLVCIVIQCLKTRLFSQQFVHYCLLQISSNRFCNEPDFNRSSVCHLVQLDNTSTKFSPQGDADITFKICRVLTYTRFKNCYEIFYKIKPKEMLVRNFCCFYVKNCFWFEINNLNEQIFISMHKSLSIVKSMYYENLETLIPWIFILEVV